MTLALTAVFKAASAGGYVAFVEEPPCASPQGETMVEARTNLREAAGLVMKANRLMAEEDLAGSTVIREPFLLTA